MSRERELKKRAQKELEDARFIVRRAKRHKVGDEAELTRLASLNDEAQKALKAKNWEALGKLLDDLEDTIDHNFARLRPHAAWESAKAFMLAVFIALVIRWFLIEPFRIPSGSMDPTLLDGDQLLVNKTVYGPDWFNPYIDPDPSEAAVAALREKGATRFQWRLFGREIHWVAQKIWLRRAPKRGEVVVFRFPDGPKEDYIKRVIGEPGDKIEIREGRLYINDVLQPETEIGPYEGPMSSDGCREPVLYEEDLIRDDGSRVHHVLLHCRDTFYGGSSTTYGPVTVPPNHFFAMGDNRDRSYDSRMWGFVPVSYLKGRASFIHLPLDPTRHYLPRWDRFFKRIY